MVGEFDRVSLLPEDSFEPVGIATFLNGPVSRTQLWIFFAFTLVSGAAFVTGFGFRISGPAFAFASLGWASYHSSWGQMLHFEHLFTLHLMILSVSPAADIWSIRSCWSRREGTHNGWSIRSRRVGARYGWPVRLLAIVTAVTYVVSAITKLRTSGFEWVNTTTLANHIAYSAARLDLLGARQPPLASFVLAQSWLIAPLAWAALLIELLAPLALIGGRWRRCWVPAALLMHAGMAATMFVWFPFHGLGFALLPLFCTEKLVAPIFRRLRRRQPT